jgi:hypothetical protein
MRLGPGRADTDRVMNDRSLPQSERGVELLLEHCAALAGAADEPRLSAFHRLEQALGGELARMLVGALGKHRSARPAFPL